MVRVVQRFDTTGVVRYDAQLSSPPFCKRSLMHMSVRHTPDVYVDDFHGRIQLHTISDCASFHIHNRPHVPLNSISMLNL